MNRREIGKQLLRPTPEFGPGGRRICRYIHCNNEVPKGRRTWCSDDCVHQYRLRGDWRYARGHLRKRERCVCQNCGTDTRKLKSGLMKLWKQAVAIGKSNRLNKNLFQFSEYKLLNLEYSQLAQDLSSKGFHGFCLELPKSWRPRKAWKEPRDLWEADHIQPVVEGGGHEPENLRTLCQPCHKAATKVLAATRAKVEGQNQLILK